MSGRAPSDPLAGDDELARLAARTGPVLFMRGVRGSEVALAAILARPAGTPPPRLATEGGEVPPRTLFDRYGVVVHRYDFALPMRRDAWYAVGAERCSVDTMSAGDLRVAFVSCNGQEEGDRERPAAERNVLWARLRAQHEAEPFHLLLHGGDQIYADEILDAHPLARAWGRPGGGAGSADAPALRELTEALGRTLLQRYLELYGQEEPAWVLARVPSLAMWDDHDICDGWGSLPDRKLDSPVGRAVFAVAREKFLVFQLGAAPDALPETMLDPGGASLGWHVRLPGLDVVAPDLRSERRRARVIGPKGWQGLEAALAGTEAGRVLLVSSVPALGPRLSIVEALMRLTPWAESYEDDLRDQWQSRTHREEWRRFLRLLLAAHETPGRQVTVVSGEIHLATRGTLASTGGPLHQLVASGITHPAPPKAYARALGGLARLGEAPLRGHPIRMHPLPGRRTIYTAQRNYLTLERRDGRWQARWELEESGTTPPLVLDPPAQA